VEEKQNVQKPSDVKWTPNCSFEMPLPHQAMPCECLSMCVFNGIWV